MLPLSLDVSAWPVLVVGTGAALARRLALVRAAGAADMRVYAADGDKCSDASIPRLPMPAEIELARLLFIAGLPVAMAAGLAAHARAHRVLVNVEDVPELCDFHVPALIRRGDLSIAISTGGRSPGLAAALRRELDQQLDAAWAERLDKAAVLRARLRSDGATMADVAQAMNRQALRWLSQGSSQP